MPVAVEQAYVINRPEHAVEYIASLIEASSLDIKYIAKYEEHLTPQYPAISIQPGTSDKVPHGTHTFGIVLRVFIYIMHSDLTVGKRTRSLNELELVTNLVALLEEDMTFGGKLIRGFVETETPAAFPPRSARGSAVVGTRLLWSGLTQRRFK